MCCWICSLQFGEDSSSYIQLLLVDCRMPVLHHQSVTVLYWMVELYSFPVWWQIWKILVHESMIIISEAFKLGSKMFSEYSLIKCTFFIPYIVYLVHGMELFHPILIKSISTSCRAKHSKYSKLKSVLCIPLFCATTLFQEWYKTK
jgi:hypothetical protein